MKPRQIVCGCVAVLALSLPGAQLPTHAQATGPLNPIGPIRQLPVPGARDMSLEPSPLDSAQPQAQGDTHTLSSIEMLGVGSLGLVRSFLDPSFYFSQSADTGIFPGTTNSVTSLGMNLTFNRNEERSRLTGSYSGAHVFDSPDSVYDTTYHNLSVSQEIHWARWVLRLHDDLVISSEASFGGLDSGGTSTQLAQQSSANINDTILTQRSRRLNDTTAGEVDYFLSRRSTVTFAGNYAALHFSNSGFINSNGITGRVGYDYALDPRDSVGLLYNYSHVTFSGSLPALQTDAIQLAYGRKITGRLAFQLSAGPQLLRSSSLRIVNWTLSSGATYQTRRAQYSISYMHGISAGSGIYAGSQNDTVSGMVRYALTRLWATSFGGGYAFNQPPTPVATVNSSFGTWYGTASASRNIGRHLQFSMNYRYQQQAAGAGTCPAATCGPTQSRQVLGGTFSWHPWPLAAQ